MPRIDPDGVEVWTMAELRTLPKCPRCGRRPIDPHPDPCPPPSPPDFSSSYIEPHPDDANHDKEVTERDARKEGYGLPT